MIYLVRVLQSRMGGADDRDRGGRVSTQSVIELLIVFIACATLGDRTPPQRSLHIVPIQLKPTDVLTAVTFRKDNVNQLWDDTLMMTGRLR